MPEEEASSIESRLSNIYRDDQGDLPDFNQLERKRSFWWFRTTVWVVGLSCVVSIAAWVGFMAWQPWRVDGAPRITVRIEAPDEVRPGKEEEVRIYWENTDLRPVQEAELQVFLPTDFVLQNASPVPTTASSTAWSLGLLPPQQKGVIALRGIFYGAVDRQATIQAIATYRYDAVDRQRQRTETYRIAYATSTVEGALTVPERMLPGDQVTIRYRVTNQSDQTLGPLTAQFVLPEGFVVSASSSQGVRQEGGRFTFPIAELPPGSVSSLQIGGTMLSGYPGDAVVTAAVGRSDVRGTFVSLSQSEARSVVLAGDLALRLIVNGSVQETPIDPGVPLRVTLAYENTSGEDLKNVSLVLSTESLVNGKRQTGAAGLIDWARMEDPQRAASSTKTQTQTLTLTSAQIPALALLPAGAKGSFDWILPVKRAPAATKEAIVRVVASAHIERVGSTGGARDVLVTALPLRYKTDADLRVEARYSTEEGAPIGFGPLPPEVGKTTGYRITWRITKRVHELERITVRAKLPAIAAWTKSIETERGTVTYDEATREIRWTIPTMSLATEDLTASFDIQVTPERADAGRFAPLIGEVTFEARDVQLNAPILRIKPALTTDLPEDDLARERGVVR